MHHTLPASSGSAPPARPWYGRQRDGALAKNVTYDDIDHIQIARPIQQEILGSRGVFLAVHVEKHRRTVGEFRKEAEAFRRRTKPPVLPVGPDGEVLRPEMLDEMDKSFFKNLIFRRPLYGADSEGTLFENDVCNHFNLNNLDTVLNVIDDPRAQIPGVHTPYLYFGMFGSMFAFHCEDADLYGINYLHTGGPEDVVYNSGGRTGAV